MTDAPNARGADRRASARYGCGSAALVRVTLPAAGATAFGYLHDLSRDGVALDLLQAVERGQELLVPLKGATGACVEVRALVVHVTTAGGLCRVGCRLAEPLPPDLLHAVLRRLRGVPAG